MQKALDSPEPVSAHPIMQASAISYPFTATRATSPSSVADFQLDRLVNTMTEVKEVFWRARMEPVAESAKLGYKEAKVRRLTG